LIRASTSGKLDTAALAVAAGCIQLSQDVLDKVAQGKALTSTERMEFAAHATIVPK